MAGTVLGGKKAAATNKARHGEDFYSRLASKGGKASKKGGFAANTVGKDGLTGRERAIVAGRKGGVAARKPKE